MFTRRFLASSLLVLLGFCSVSEGVAQRQDVKTAKFDQLFDTFMRRGD